MKIFDKNHLSFICVSVVFTLCAATAEPRLLWRESLAGAAISEISAEMGAVIAVCEGGSVKAFGLNGSLLWNFKETGRFLPFLTRSRSSAIYVCKSNGDFIALNRAGFLQWRLPLRESVTMPALIGWDGRVFIFLEKHILCYTASGYRLWRLELSAPAAAGPVLNGTGGISLILKDNSLVHISAFGELNKIELYSQPDFLLPVQGGSLDARILLVYSDGRLEMYGISGASAGKSYGNLSHLGGAPLAAASLRGYAAVQLASGHLVLFDAIKGLVVWKENSLPGVGAAANMAQKTRIQFDEENGNIYVLSISGAACFSAGGAEVWSMRLENAVVRPAFDCGIIYSSAKDWLLYAYRAENRPETGAKTNLAPLGSYGLGIPPKKTNWDEFISNYSDGESAVLSQLEYSIRSGNIGAGEPLVQWVLMGLAGDAGLAQKSRAEALRLLGYIGCGETVRFLCERLRMEDSPSVQVEAALSLGRIGCDPEGLAFNVFERIISLNQPVRNEPLVSAAAAAIGNMCRFSGPPLSARGVKLLVAIAGEGSSRAARQKARRELDKLSKLM